MMSLLTRRCTGGRTYLESLTAVRMVDNVLRRGRWKKRFAGFLSGMLGLDVGMAVFDEGRFLADFVH